MSDKSSVIELLEFAADVLERENIAFWLDYGTLLGAVRKGRFIQGDSDADLGIFFEDLDSIKTALGTKDYVVYDAFRGSGLQVYKSPKSKIHIDLFGWYDDAGTMKRNFYVPGTDNNKGKDFPAEWLDPLTTVQFEGRVYPAPRWPEKMCAFRYGPTWKTPLGIGAFNKSHNPNR